MSLEQFLDRMVAPGNFLAVSVQYPKGLGNRFFARDNVAEAASYIRWASDDKGWDTYYALASYKAATLETNQKTQRQYYKGSRSQANAQQLRLFWFDADIKRDGDGKDPERVFADVPDLVRWTRGFSQATGVPLPNVWVRSGYGAHLYWVLDQALDRDAWQPYADALKNLLITHHARGDTSVVADAARILRPVETFNYKVKASPAPCFYMVNGANYTDADVLPKLQAIRGYNNIVIQPTIATPTKRPTKPGSMAANAKAGLSAQPRDFALIAQHCPQVRRSWSEGGEHDGRQLWHALITLAFFCEDARVWSHAIGNNHPAYDPADTDAEVDRVEAEHKAKSFGAPLCATFEAERPALCASCPHHGKITTPYQLGLRTGPYSPNDLPAKFRRNNGWIERLVEEEWRRVVQGDISDPILEEVESRLRLTFTFTRSDRVAKTVIVHHDEPNYRNGRELFSMRGIQLQVFNYKPFVDLILAWIDELLAACQLRNEPLPSFGWARDDQGYTGFAVGGTFYAADGSETPALGADPALLRRYDPKGSLAGWQKAASFVAADVPALHTAIAAAFGAPLMTFSGEAGSCIAFVGPSGVGKTSAFSAGAAVWGQPQHTMISLDDTSNYQTLVLGQTRAMPVYWDEAKLATKDKQIELVNMLHKLTQGRDKGRLTAEIKMREAGEWTTIFPLSTNNSVVELVAAQDGHKSATLVRVLEIGVPKRDMQGQAGAARIVQSLQNNHGHAGIAFARYIAQHAPQLEVMVTKAKQLIMDHTAPSEIEERFYVAAAASIIAGARLARHLQLIDLDIKGIVEVLKEAILQARHERQVYEPKDPGSMLVRALEDFCADHMNSRVVTAHLARRGPKTLGSQEPREQLPLVIGLPTPAFQIAAADYAIRIDRGIFVRWCQKKGLPSSDLMKQMVETWNGVFNRGPIGAGTSYFNWRTHFFQLWLGHPDLIHILDEFPEYLTTGSGTSTQKVVPLRSSGLKRGLAPSPTIN